MPQALSPISYLAQPMDALLGSPGMLRVLRVLIRHGGQLTTARLVRETKLSLPGLLKVLHQLEALGVLDVSGSGRARLFRAIARHPLVGMLETLVQSEAQYRGRVLHSVREAAEGLGLISLLLFGSAARFEDRFDSDLDLLMVTTEADLATHETIAQRFRERLANDPELMGLKPSVVALTMVDLKVMAASNHPLWQDLGRDAELLAGRSPRVLSALLETAA